MLPLADLQALLAEANYYRGAIDGLTGPLTRRGVEIVEQNARQAGLAWASAAPDWPWDRRYSAAAQTILNALGFEAGVVDGWFGHNSNEARIAWASARAGTSAAVPRQASPSAVSGKLAKVDLPRQRECAAFYGEPGTAAIEARMTYARLPFEMRIDWNLRQRTARLRVHEKCAPSLVLALTAAFAEYGEDRFRELGLDRYAGGFNPRRMRGGSSWSMHAYGCAIDIYAAPNALRMRCPEALFCGPEYRPFLDIMEDHGWLPAIRLWGGDAMHFQQARL